MIRQLPLDLPHRPNYAEEDFLAAPSNSEALALLGLWPDWPHRLLVLTGPPGAGKSHLGAIWARRAAATVVPAQKLDLAALPDLVKAPALLVEDADRPRLPENDLREKELFHLINLAIERGTFLLITARKPPDAWGLRTRDLLSRLRRAPIVAIQEPDEAFLRAILVKLFQDRQIKVDANLIDYLALRLDRSFAAARAIVAALDAEGLARRRPVTRALAGELLAAWGDHDEDH
ncbi:DnaA/Hda family protein [Rhodoblastus sp.]|uniref:DnaA ATPase domain-containing protein n=1 Tax=Rhodoblastus sp. TaxID=1962975 RepID=UPI002611B631|nr:DnaA/Hda family protein [Rhodoblastus sp.]